MKNAMLAGVTVVALAAAGPAIAADMPVKAPAAPPVVDLWSGFYVGANAGYSWGNWGNNAINGNFPPAPNFSTVATVNVKGWVGGGQVGWNKLYGSWLVGLEADLQATGQKADLNDSATFVIGATITTISELNRWKLPWFATARGRVGAVVADNWLLYATGGVAVARAYYSHTSSATVGAATATLVFDEGTTRVGPVLGAGIEKAIDAHWRVKAEYLYIDLGSHTFISGSGFDNTIKMRDNIVRVGLNYRFLPN